MLIALEGIDGSGKSTQILRLREKLSESGFEVYSTFEPTSGDYGKEIRKIFSGQKKVSQYTIAALFLADRLEHILDPDDGMLAQISSQKLVITDRYYLSSYAYHGAHIDMDWVMDINSKPVQLLPADLHIYLDIPPQKALERLSESRENLEIYETESNLKNVYNAYQVAIAKLATSENIVTIDATLPAEQVSELIWDAVQQLLNQ